MKDLLFWLSEYNDQFDLSFQDLTICLHEDGKAQLLHIEDRSIYMEFKSVKKLKKFLKTTK